MPVQNDHSMNPVPVNKALDSIQYYSRKVVKYQYVLEVST